MDIGVYRVSIATAAVEQPGLIERLLKEFGTAKLTSLLYRKAEKFPSKAVQHPQKFRRLTLQFRW